MSFIETTLVVRGDVAAAQADVLASDVADAATNGYLLIQANGTAQAGNASVAAATAMLKLSVATPQPDGSTAIVGTSEFKRSDIYSYNYAAPSAGAAQSYAISNFVLGSENTVRLEMRDGVNVHDVMSFSGTTPEAIAAEFNNRADKERFKNVSMSAATTTMSVSVASNGYSTVITGSDHLTTFQGTALTPARGQQSNVIAFEKRSNISMGAYNQTEFPIVVPASATVAGADYGIYTIELRKTLPGKRKVTEVIRIAIKDDEAASNKLVGAIQTILGISGADVTAPAAFTAQFDAATYSVQGAAAIGFDFATAEVGTTYNWSIISDAVGAVASTGTGTVAGATENIDTGLTADAYTAGEVLTLSVTLTDAGGNTTAATANDTATIAA